MKSGSGDITQLGYTPSGRRLDVEVFPFSDILRRSPPATVRATHRYDFQLLLLVTDGTPTQVVDFEPVQCAPGSILPLRPGQVHSFGADLDWEGWLVLFRPEFLPTGSDVPSDLAPGRMLERMPDHIVLDQEAFLVTRDAIVAMADDARSSARADIVHTLLRYQLCTLILRLDLLNGQQSAAGVQSSPSLKRFAISRIAGGKFLRLAPGRPICKGSRLHSEKSQSCFQRCHRSKCQGLYRTAGHPRGQAAAGAYGQADLSGRGGPRI